jgi:hypothetical protein
MCCFPITKKTFYFIHNLIISWSGVKYFTLKNIVYSDKTDIALKNIGMVYLVPETTVLML